MTSAAAVYLHEITTMCQELTFVVPYLNLNHVDMKPHRKDNIETLWRAIYDTETHSGRLVWECGFPQQRARNVDLWNFLCYWHE